MKTKFRFLLYTLLILQVLNQNTIAQSPLESGRKIPVYPGSRLIANKEEGEDESCCNFVASDSYEKVISFYENSLKLKPLDVSGLAAQLPFLKAQTDAMLKEMPPSMKIRFFVLKVVEFQGQKGAELFEVYSSGEGVEFTIMDSQLTPEDMHFAEEYENTSKPVPADPNILAKVLPSSGPVGYDRGETNIQEGEASMQASADTFFRKLIKKGTGSGEDGSQDYYSTIGVTVSECDPEFITGMMETGPGDKNVTLKGLYKAVLRTEKSEYFGQSSVSYTIAVNNKFLVEIQENGLGDINLINQVLDKINFAALPK